jgi:hypothetical protein
MICIQFLNNFFFLSFNLAPKPRRRMSELIPNDPLRDIEQHAPKIFDSSKLKKKITNSFQKIFSA